jgi:hypothetical protein
MSEESMNLQQAKEWLEGEGAPHDTYDECCATFAIATKNKQYKTAAAARLAACEFCLCLPVTTNLRLLSEVCLPTAEIAWLAYLQASIPDET